ncbi:MAG: hypothetical protein IPP29_16840 [Bacteroidetes bacterium]|nr:hypothetical protein [Bacteroidota bacterium]
MATTSKIDFDFLAKHEGTKLSAYVPVCTLKSTKNKNSPVCYRKRWGPLLATAVLP